MMIRLALTALICLFLTFPSWAKDDNTKNKLEPLPEIQSMDIATYAAQSNKIQKEFENDPELNFTVDLPSNFIERASSNLKNKIQNTQLIGEIYNAYGPAIQDMRPYFSVQSIALDRLISAKNWFIADVLQKNYTLRGISADKYGDVFEAFYIRLDSFGRTEIVRARGFLHENRLIIAEYVLPILLWESDRDKQIFAIKSFEFKDQIKIEPAEPVNDYAFLDSFYTQYPKSWILTKNNVAAVNRIDLQFKTADVDGFAFAESNLTLVSNQSLKDKKDNTFYQVNLSDVIQERMTDISNRGYDIGDLIERYNYDLKINNVVLNTTEVYPLSRKIEDTYVRFEEQAVLYELWLSVIRTRDDSQTIKNYVVATLSPPRDKNMQQWAWTNKFHENLIRNMQ